MSPNDRVKELRQALKMTQTEFGEKLGVSKGVIVNLELSRVEVKELMINLICRTFKVNTLWLEKGEGEMFTDVSDILIDEIADEFQLSPKVKKTVANYLKLPPDEQEKVIELLHKILDE